MKDDIWIQEINYICPVCGFEIPDVDCGGMVKGSEERGLIMRCSNCGNDGILLQEYW